MYGRTVVFLILFMIGPVAISAPKNFEEIQVRWSSAYKKEINSNYLTKDPITAPKGARVVLAQIDLLTKKFKSITDCLVYQIPSPGKPGELFFIESKVDKNCEEQKFASSYFSYPNIFNLKLEETNSKIKIYIDRFNLNFNFYNILNQNLESESADFQFKIPGVLVSFIESSAGKNILNEFQVCSEVPSDKCSLKSKDLCHLCPSGKSYHVIASDCPGNSIRSYCGHKECGVKGSPACIRGRVSSGYKGTYCITDSPMGFCSSPARVVCLNNELYCR